MVFVLGCTNPYNGFRSIKLLTIICNYLANRSFTSLRLTGISTSETCMEPVLFWESRKGKSGIGDPLLAVRTKKPPIEMSSLKFNKTVLFYL
jgi:hypothetical protein